MAHWRAILLTLFLCASKLGNGNTIHTGGQKVSHVPASQVREAEVESKAKVIPRLTRAEKYALIVESGQDPYGKMRERLQRRGPMFRHIDQPLDRNGIPRFSAFRFSGTRCFRGFQREHMRLNSSFANLVSIFQELEMGKFVKENRKSRQSGHGSAMRHREKSLNVTLPPLLARPISVCPPRFDAVTRGHNGRTYLFSRDVVYETWRQENLQQKASFFIHEMFPKGPRTVTAAYTNSRSGVTVLIERTNVYRYRWNRDTKRFFLARKSPQQLSKNITFTPRLGFQWIDNNQVLMEGDEFVIYDAYWNTPTFKGAKEDYFQNLPDDMIGVAVKSQSLLLIYTASNTIQAFDTKKHKILQEYPIQTKAMVGCT